MKIKTIKWKNFISNDKMIEINFMRKFKKEDKERFLSDHLFSRERSKIDAKDSILKIISLIGKNTSYKSSLLKSISKILSFITNFKDNVDNFFITGLDFDKVMKWHEKKYHNSLLNRPINFNMTFKEYEKENNKKSKIEKSKKEYVTDFYVKNAFNKNNPLFFSVEFINNENETKLYTINISKRNDIFNWLFMFNNKQIDIYKEKINFKYNFASFESYNVYGRNRLLEDKDIFLERALAYLYKEKFQKNKEKLEKFLKIIDPSITLLSIKENKDGLVIFKNIERNYGGTKESINLSELSTGTKMFLVYLYYILENDFIIIDELEQSLHKSLVTLLIDIARSNNKQIIFSTHDPTIIEKNLRMYELYILDIEENKLKIQKGSDLFRDQKDSFIKKYFNDLVSNILKSDLDLIRMIFY